MLKVYTGKRKRASSPDWRVQRAKRLGNEKARIAALKLQQGAKAPTINLIPENVIIPVFYTDTKPLEDL